MITAHFEGKKLYIDISQMDEKYKEIGKEISFELFYGIELTNGENDYFSKVGEVKFKYNGENEVYIELDEVKTGYRGETIWIGYYIKADLGSKMLIFRETKEIEILGREDSVFKSSELENIKSGEYIGYTDKINRKEILSEVFKNYFKDSLLFIPNLLEKLFSSFLSFVIFGFLIVSVGTFLFIIIGAIAEINKLYGYIAVVIIYFILVFIFSYIEYSKLGINIHFNDEFLNLTKKLPKNINIKNILSGKTKKNLDNIEIKIFGINQERGWYEYDCGSSTCTAYINHTVGNVLLFSKKIDSINKGENISNYLDYELDMAKIYENLFYPQIFTSQMGLFTGIEIRIISKKYKDVNHIFYLDLDKNKFKKQVETKNTLKEDENNSFNNDFFI